MRRFKRRGMFNRDHERMNLSADEMERAFNLASGWRILEDREKRAARRRPR